MMRIDRLFILVLLVCCLGVVVQGFTYEDKEVETEAGRAAMFERWKSHHKLEGGRNKADKKKQYENFKANLKLVHATNKAGKSYKLELNRFAGMNHQELMSIHGGLKGKDCPNAQPCAPDANKGDEGQAKRDGQPFMYRNFTDIPPKMDWRTKNALGPVKNQGCCGSCYAFAAVEAVEALHAIKTGELIETSPKEIVDCCTNCGGCKGGYVTTCYEYIEKNGGLTTMKNYPYVAEEGPCNVKKEHDVVVHVHGHENMPSPGIESDIYKAVSNQPISCALEWPPELGMYKEGVYDGPSEFDGVGHAVPVVGWDETPDGKKYWIIKNSWGPDWGEKGYARIARENHQEGHVEGQNRIAHWCAYPTLEDTGTKHKDGDMFVSSSQEL